MPPLAPWKALRWQGQASAVVGQEKPTTPASPPPDPTLSAGAALSEAKVEKSIEMGMAALEKLSRFGPNPTPEVTLPKKSVVPLPLAMEASGSTAEAGADARA
jgi:hypothetical protein